MRRLLDFRRGAAQVAGGRSRSESSSRKRQPRASHNGQSVRRIGSVKEQPDFFSTQCFSFSRPQNWCHASHARTCTGQRYESAHRFAHSMDPKLYALSRARAPAPHTPGPVSEPDVTVLGVRRSFGRYRSDPASSAQRPAQSTALRPPIAIFGAAFVSKTC